ncbi:RNA-binding S4 domain-containing protein [Tepidibacter aestuarii]|uniref:RNA-binding S4 domain-containing protein n=1 Tax=Tepidibacter aestuarii TaxID=2925782 RepID=UPI0020BF50CF|nr:RNA-binding S4 domain-containing protein [Tepidibacter aestuarii]CAH2215333.1 RNA binding protein involved in ribosome maturation [Tepidibacter aestuarii]
MKQIKIDSEFIKLDQLLKLADMVGSGGHAKSMILDGEVKVNGEVAYQRGKKIRSNDIVEVDSIKIKVL